MINPFEFQPIIRVIMSVNCTCTNVANHGLDHGTKVLRTIYKNL